MRSSPARNRHPPPPPPHPHHHRKSFAFEGADLFWRGFIRACVTGVGECSCCENGCGRSTRASPRSRCMGRTHHERRCIDVRVWTDNTPPRHPVRATCRSCRMLVPAAGKLYIVDVSDHTPVTTHFSSHLTFLWTIADLRLQEENNCSVKEIVPGASGARMDAKFCPYAPNIVSFVRCLSLPLLFLPSSPMPQRE